MKCQCLCEAREMGKECGKKARFKIIDIICDYDRDSEFWVCDDCLKYFINQKEEEPHFIILKEARD